jgi:hypothetical protein
MSYQKGDFEYDNDRSNRDFYKIVWPRISREWDWFLGCELMPLEKSPKDGVGLLLDRAGGIDYVARRRIGGLVPIASRVQGNFGFRTFTTRYRRPGGQPTEFKKIRDALDRGDLVPKFQTHAYVNDNGEMLNAFGISVRDLYQHIEAIGKLRTNKSDGVEFIYTEVDTLVSLGVEVKESRFSAGEFLARCHEKHRAYLHDKPVRLHGASWSNKCPRCDGTGRAPTPYAGYVRCGLCAGGGLVQKGASR